MARQPSPGAMRPIKATTSSAATLRCFYPASCNEIMSSVWPAQRSRRNTAERGFQRHRDRTDCRRCRRYRLPLDDVESRAVCHVRGHGRCVFRDPELYRRTRPAGGRGAVVDHALIQWLGTAVRCRHPGAGGSATPRSGCVVSESARHTRAPSFASAMWALTARWDEHTRRLPPTWQRLGIERAGDAWESYVSDPTKVPEAELLTYVYYPVAHTGLGRSTDVS